MRAPELVVPGNPVPLFDSEQRLFCNPYDYPGREVQLAGFELQDMGPEGEVTVDPYKMLTLAAMLGVRAVSVRQRGGAAGLDWRDGVATFHFVPRQVMYGAYNLTRKPILGEGKTPDDPDVWAYVLNGQLHFAVHNNLNRLPPRQLRSPAISTARRLLESWNIFGPAPSLSA